MAKPGSFRYFPGVKIIKSDFDFFSAAHIVARLMLAMLLAPHVFKRARQLATPHNSRKAWLKRLYRALMIVRYKPDVIHFQWAAHISDYANLIESGRYITVISLRGTQINVDPFLDNQLAKAYRKLFPHCFFHAVSHTIGMRAQQFGAKADRIRVIYSPVPAHFTDSYKPLTGLPDTKLKIVSVGRFHWIKGYTYAFEAIRMLKARGIQVVYTLIASGQIPGEILYQLKDRGLEQEVVIVPHVNYRTMPSELQQHDVLLLPSVEEGIANVVLEAMAVGLPVVSTMCGGMDEVIRSGENGWLVPIRNSVGMADALQKFTSTTPEKLNAITEAAYQTIRTKFDYQTGMTAFEELYPWVLKQKQ
ncbi:MAG: glycosyltransferase family 4 protein [Cyclobacteriaceae bacterium]|nr:MAG: glycosyltransferase family 4 protein [Cyclobacteriaceae bacterium]